MSRTESIAAVARGEEASENVAPQVERGAFTEKDQENLAMDSDAITQVQVAVSYTHLTLPTICSV